MSRSGQSDLSRLDPERIAHALLAAAPTALYVFDLAERAPLFVSPGGPAMLGLDAAAIAAAGSDFLPRTMHPDDWPRVTAHFVDFSTAADGETRVLEYRMRAGNGTWRWLRSHDVVFRRDPDGQPSQILGLAFDVTEHKAADQALQESEAGFRSLAEALPQFVWVTEPDGVLSYVNERWTAFSGLDLAQTNDRAAVAALVHPDDRDHLAAAWAESFALDVPLEIEARMRGRDGRYRWFLIRGVPVANGTGARWFGTSTDITAAKEDASRLERLQAATAALSAAATPMEVHRVAMQTVIDLGARAGALYEMRGDELVLVEVTGFAAPLVEQYRRITREAPIPLADAVRRVAPVWIRSRQDYVDQYPHLTEQIAMLDTEAAVSLPLVVDDRVTGVLNFTFVEILEYGIGEQRFLLTLASLTAQALERSRLYALARAANERFDLAERAARAFSFAWEPGTNHVERSAGFSAVLGYEVGDVDPTWEAWNELVHPDQRTLSRQDALAPLEGAGPETQGIEYQVRHKDGSYRWLSQSATTIRDAAGGVLAVVGHAVDVTERKEAEAALGRSEERYRDLLGRIEQGFCVFELLYGQDGHPYDYRFLEVNPTFTRHTGLLDAVGKTARELVPDLEERWVLRYAEVAETGIAQRFEQGSEAMGRWFEVEAVRVGGEGSRKVALLFADVSERKRIEADLQASAYRLRIASEAARIGIHDYDVVTNQIIWDDTVRALWGIGPDEPITYDTFIAGLHRDDLAATELMVARALDPTGNGTYSAEFRVIHRGDGSLRWIAATGQVFFASGKAVRLIGTAQDITERKEAEEERIAFLDALAHDVKNPLGVAKGRAQLTRRQVRRGLNDPGTLDTSLARIEVAVNNAASLIDELLDVAHLRAGRSLELQLMPTDLEALAQTCVEEARQRSVLHTVRVASDSPGLVGQWDAERLGRVLRNLLDNALKFSPEGGEIHVGIVRKEDETGNWAELAVTDQGVGIPVGDLTRVFERFSRGGNVAGITGTGIGLAGSKQIVEQHGGVITVESVEGVGSTFTVRLPL